MVQDGGGPIGTGQRMSPESRRKSVATIVLPWVGLARKVSQRSESFSERLLSNNKRSRIYTSWPTCMLYRCGVLAVSLESVVDSANILVTICYEPFT